MKDLKNILRRWGIWGILLACGACSLYSFLHGPKAGSDDPLSLKNNIRNFINHRMELEFFQISRYLDSQEDMDTRGIAERLLLRQFMLYDYAMKDGEQAQEREDALMAEIIGQYEGTDEDIKNIDEEHLDYGEDALHIENSILEEMERENSLHNTQSGEETEGNVEQNKGESLEDGAGEENALEEAAVPEGGFVEAAYPAYTYDWSEKWDYETIVSNFYAVDNSTRLKEEYVGLNQLLYQDLSVNKEADGPQILIYHTHSREDFIDSVPGDKSTTIVGAGDKLAQLLEEKYGFQVMHHTEEYDTVRDDAYNKSLPAIEKILEENPTIEVVIDLHRDAVAGDRKLVMDLQGRPTARFMFFNGLSCSRKSGDITYLENPYIQENLSFSFQAQVAANEYYPGIARKVYLKAYRFNMHLKPRSMLIELGAQNNTVEEIMNACDPLAHILAIVLG
ncbi:MAG: stage II sporulation protein P [Lachnospiraceae bacterium]|nr:stage II sporulation protein P [Lachnospiraceae bacterium]